ncbi:MAG: hypothetical protein U0572_14365 [Phycisphaerales bacterium]
MVPDISLWLAWIVGFLGAVSIVALVWHALFGDKSHGRRRCPRCWHDMTGATSLRCTECGHDAPSEEALFRTRPYWGRAILWLAVLVGGAIYLRLQVTQQGVVTFLPARALVWFLPSTPSTAGSTSEVLTELLVRLSAGSLSDEVLERLVDRVVEGDDEALPCSPEWQTRYGPIALALIGAAENETDSERPMRALVERLRALPPHVAIAVGAPVRADSDIPAELALLEWWPPSTEARVRIHDPTRSNDDLWGLDAGTRNAPVPVRLGPIAPGETERVVEVGIRVRPTGDDGRPIPGAAWSDERVVTVTVPLKAAAEAAPLEPLSSPAADAAVANVFEQGVVRWTTGPRPAAFMFDVQRTGAAEFVDVLFGIEISLLEGDAVRRTLHAWWLGGPRGGQWRAELVSEDLEALRRLPSDGAGWRLRVRGTQDLAQRALVPLRTTASGKAPVATKFWSGDLFLPVNVTSRPGEAPRRRWFHPRDDAP